MPRGGERRRAACTIYALGNVQQRGLFHVKQSPDCLGVSRETRRCPPLQNLSDQALEVTRGNSRHPSGFTKRPRLHQAELLSSLKRKRGKLSILQIARQKESGHLTESM